ncbi:MAG: hypothetical protein KAW94_03505 [Candidatus Thorarchaeota archaeon]|nr:hypothetical protein [Candidatus Thorarchaeota archaeon]
MENSDKCKWLDTMTKGYGCKLRNQILAVAEATAKCAKPKLADICMDAYSSLTRAQESIDTNSTDAFPWLVGSASQFAILGEFDNAIGAYVKAINFAASLTLIDRGYESFCKARQILEDGLQRSDPSLQSPALKQELAKAGQKLIKSVKAAMDGSPQADLQAELKASILGGISLKRAEKEDDAKDLVIVDGKALYEKKAVEYKEGADKYIQSGMLKNAVVFACMAALADLMLGRPKEGISYLATTAADSGHKDEFTESLVFEWTKLVFKSLVGKNVTAIDEATTLFLKIPWGFRDDKEFGRRVMDSVRRKISQ